MIRIEGRHFTLSLACATCVNALVILLLIPMTEGVNSKAIGPQIDFDITAGGILGAAVEPTDVAEDTISEDPLPEEEQAEDIPEPEVTETKQARVEDTIAPHVDAEAVIIEEPVVEEMIEEKPLTAEPEPLPAAKPVKEIKKEKAKSKRTKKTSKSRKRVKSGLRKKGAGGSGKGGGGKARASRGAIASYKSRVQARMASCIRSRISGRGIAGRVRIRFGVSPGGSVRGVSVSGTGALRGIARSAARGCSMPSPPRGAGGVRFGFPVSVR